MSNRSPLQPGVIYHIFARGNNRENIFIRTDNYRYFIDKYIEHIAPVADTFAYCLLRNHFHLLVRIKTPSVLHAKRDSTSDVVQKHLGSPSPSQTFANFLNAYAKAINQMYGRTGSLFQHPFGRIPVTTESYLLNLVHYIHFNPQKHGFVQDFREYPYSSFHVLVSNKFTRLQRAEVIEWFGSQEEFQTFHAEFHDDNPIRGYIGDDPD